MNKTIYKVTTTTCGTCKMVQPHWDKAKKANPDVEFIEVIADKSEEDMQFAKEYRVSQLPTFIVLEGGKEIKRHQGFASEAQIRDLIS